MNFEEQAVWMLQMKINDIESTTFFNSAVFEEMSWMICSFHLKTNDRQDGEYS